MTMDNENAIRINLDNYPHLARMKASDPANFQKSMKSFFSFLDAAYENKHFAKSENYFQLDYISLLGQITEALFDYKGILNHHYSQSEAEIFKVLEMENNPLAATAFFTSDGKTITKDQFFGEEDRSFKSWFQGMLYAGKYLSHIDLVKYLLLPDFHLVENMQNEHIEKLIAIQPALKYQQENGIRIGALVQGTGFWDVGTFPTITSRCPVCYSEKLHTEPFHKLHYCLHCHAAIPFIPKA